MATGGTGLDDRTLSSTGAGAWPIVPDRSVSVVIPAFHAEDTIQRAVQSVVQQRGVDVEIVVVIDDGSKETKERVEQLGLACCRVLMNDGNLGAQVTRNRGLAEATRPFVLFLDADDFQTGDLLRGLFDAAHEAEADLAFGPWRILLGDGMLLPIQIPEAAPAATIFWRWLVDGIWVSPTAVLWRTEYVRSIGGWDVRVRRHQDTEITLRAIAMGARLAFSREGVGIYEHHDSEHRITRSQNNYDSLLDLAEFLLGTDGVIPRETRQAAISRYLYRMAVEAFRRGDEDFGARALASSRQLGFRGHLGRIARVGSTLLGVRRYNRLVPKVRRRWSSVRHR